MQIAVRGAQNFRANRTKCLLQKETEVQFISKAMWGFLSV
jgi:hypothetical protein